MNRLPRTAYSKLTNSLAPGSGTVEAATLWLFLFGYQRTRWGDVRKTKHQTKVQPFSAYKTNLGNKVKPDRCFRTTPREDEACCFDRRRRFYIERQRCQDMRTWSARSTAALDLRLRKKTEQGHVTYCRHALYR